jgi:hypothetical protein
MLLSGCMNGASMLSSLLVTKSTIFRFLFDDIASHFNSGHCLSLLHLRNCPIAFTGKLQFFDKEGNLVDPKSGVDGQIQPNEPKMDVIEDNAGQ